MVEIKGWWRQGLGRSRGGGGKGVVRVKGCGWWGSSGWGDGKCYGKWGGVVGVGVMG